MPSDNTSSEGSSQSSSSSSAVSVATSKGAGSSATATSSNGETSSSREQIFTPGATSSSGRATAVATDRRATTTVDVDAPASESDFPNEIDPLTGVASIRTGEVDTLIGFGGANTFKIGNARKVFYTDNGNTDFALIRNFKPGQDLIQINGANLEGYSFANDADGNGLIFFNNDLIAAFQGVNIEPILSAPSFHFV